MQLEGKSCTREYLLVWRHLLLEKQQSGKNLPSIEATCSKSWLKNGIGSLHPESRDASRLYESCELMLRQLHCTQWSVTAISIRMQSYGGLTSNLGNDLYSTV